MFSDSAEDMAAKWVLESGIQNVSGDVKTSGGFNGWFDVNSGSYPFIYSEITGYGMSSLIYLKGAYNSDVFLERAKLAAKWIINNAITPEGGVLTKYYYARGAADDGYKFENRNVFAFDAGVVLYGLCNVALETNDEDTKKNCHKIAEFLVNNMLKKNGEFHAAWNLKSNEPLNDESKWSTRSGSYHAKIALGMIKMHEMTGESVYEKAAEAVCEAAVKSQKEDGRFVTHGNSTHLHPHCYSAEGLLYAGKKLGRKDFLESSLKATEWALRAQKENGGIPFLFENGFVHYERTDVLAQVLRLGSVFMAERLLAASHNMDRLRNRLAGFQVNEGQQAGGIEFGYDFDGIRKSHLNSWCTMFSMQAFRMNSLFKSGRKIDLEIIV